MYGTDRVGDKEISRELITLTCVSYGSPQRARYTIPCRLFLSSTAIDIAKSKAMFNADYLISLYTMCTFVHIHDTLIRSTAMPTVRPEICSFDREMFTRENSLKCNGYETKLM